MAASLTITGDLTISNTAALDATATPYNLTVGGNWTNTSTNADPFVQRTSTVTFNGTSAQSITQSNNSLETFATMVVNKSSGTLTLVNSVDATSTLTMTAGNIDAGSNTLTLGVSTPTEGTLNYTDGTIIGNFKRFLTTTGAKLFPVGTSSYYRPITITINTLTASGSLTTKFVAADPGANSISSLSESGLTLQNQFTDGYWNVTAANSFATSNYDVTAVATSFSSYTLTSDRRIVKRTNASGNWALDGTHSNLSGSTAYRTGLTGGISNLASGTQFGLGTTDCASFTTSSITGSTDDCVSETGSPYSVTDNGRTYTWSIPGGEGSIASGQGTASITVDWGATATPAATLQVIENSACYTATAVTLDVAIHSNVTSAISGPTSAPQNVTGSGPYSVTARTGYTYTWSVPAGNGSIASGQGTNSVTVDWGAAAAATLRVVGQYTGCTAAANRDLSVTVYAPITTTADGNWNADATWSCACASGPANTDNVQILNTHDVTISDASKTINDITIDAGGTLTHNATYNLTVTGFYSNSGSHNLGSNSLILNSAASGTQFKGTGTLTNVAGLQFNNYDFTIPSTANLSITNTGAVAIANNLVITNNGTITISGNMTGGNSNSTWINSTSSTLKIGGTLLSTGVLSASASGNTVEYNGTSAQNLKAPSSSYYNLTLSDASGSSIKTMQSAIDVDNDLTISGTAALDVSASNYTLYVGGDWDVTSTNANPFVERSGTVIFDGSAAQTLNTVLAGGETFNNLTMSNSSTGLTLNYVGATNVSGTLTMTSGNITTTSTKYLTLKGSASTSGGSNSSYVSGPMRHTVNVSTSTSKTFLVGAGGYLRKAILTVDQNTATSTEYEGTLTASSANALGYTMPGTIDLVSKVRYWTISQLTAENIDAATVTLYYDTDDQVTDYTNLAVAKTDITGTAWTDLSGTATANTTGNIVSGNFTTFSKFALANKLGGGNPLPIELLSFDLEKINNNTRLIWVTATEKNNRHFIIERAADNENYFPIGYVRSKKENSNEKLNYEFTDEKPLQGLNYYRLKQVDIDGNFDYTPVRVIEFEEDITTSFEVYPNPTTAHHPLNIKSIHRFLPHEEVLVVLIDLNGKEYYSKMVVTEDDGSFLEAIDIMDRIPSGTYIIKASDGQDFESRVVVIQ